MTEEDRTAEYVASAAIFAVLDGTSAGWMELDGTNSTAIAPHEVYNGQEEEEEATP